MIKKDKKLYIIREELLINKKDCVAEITDILPSKNGEIYVTYVTGVEVDVCVYEWGLYEDYNTMKKRRNELLKFFIKFIINELENGRELKYEYENQVFIILNHEIKLIHFMYKILSKAEFKSRLYSLFKLV